MGGGIVDGEAVRPGTSLLPGTSCVGSGFGLWPGAPFTTGVD